jgi:hypothetical protein
MTHFRTVDARNMRDSLLLKCDYLLLPDSPIIEGTLNQWKIYRQELRDVTEQVDFPTDVVWPTSP